MKTRSLCWAALAVLAMSPAAARAHALSFEITRKDEVIDILAYYDDDTPCQQGLVRIELGKKLIASGKTDDTGRWSFARPSPGRYRITVNDGAGHFAEAPMTIRSTTADPTEPVDEGPSRASFTAVRWAGLAMGLAVIAGLAVAARSLLRRRSKSPH